MPSRIIWRMSGWRARKSSSFMQPTNASGENQNSKKLHRAWLGCDLHQERGRERGRWRSPTIGRPLPFYRRRLVGPASRVSSTAAEFIELGVGDFAPGHEQWIAAHARGATGDHATAL